MPLYEYACTKCGEITEVMQKISDPPPGSCPACGGRKMERVISRSSFQLKGGGWYSEGYSSGGSKKGSTSSADSKSATKAEGSSPKTESKAAESKPAESKPAESKPAKPAKKD